MEGAEHKPMPADGYRLCFVDWVDSCEQTPNADLSVYEFPEPQRIFQAGFLVHEEDDYIVLAGGLKPASETFDYVIAIPRVSIVTIRDLDMSRGDE